MEQSASNSAIESSGVTARRHEPAERSPADSAALKTGRHADGIDRSSDGVTRQVTFAPYGHTLTNVNAWSPDSRHLVYDIRPGSEFEGTRIEQVDVETLAVQVVHESRHGAACGVVTYSPTEPKVVFIVGPEHPTPDWQYGFTRRYGVVVDVRHPECVRPLDAMNYAPSFVPGALRGGSHVHVFSPDGKWVSFTYEDEILAQLDADPNAAPHDRNQRTIGVAGPFGPVEVNREHPRNREGDFFSVLVTRTKSDPQPGSDDIVRAFEEGWVGVDGYLRADGTRQRRALAFQGVVTGRNGEQWSEVFIVDLPDDLTRAGDAPLGGTSTTRPAPPQGTIQRRLTFTGGREFPGVVSVPRHWLRASPSGDRIAFLMKDATGAAQLWTVSPRGGPIQQVSYLSGGIASAFTWSPDGRLIAHVADHSVFVTEVATGWSYRITPPNADAGPEELACVFSPEGRSIAYQQKVGAYSQLFVTRVPTLG